MSRTRLSAACIALLLPLLVGCGSTRYVEVELEFRDADTQDPIEGARVWLHWEENFYAFGARRPPSSEWNNTAVLDQMGRGIFSPLAEGRWAMDVDVTGYDIQSHDLMLFVAGAVEGREWAWKTCKVYRLYPFAIERMIEYRIVSLAPVHP